MKSEFHEYLQKMMKYLKSEIKTARNFRAKNLPESMENFILHFIFSIVSLKVTQKGARAQLSIPGELPVEALVTRALLRTQGWMFGRYQQTLNGSFSAVPKPTFANECRDL